MRAAWGLLSVALFGCAGARAADLSAIDPATRAALNDAVFAAPLPAEQMFSQRVWAQSGGHDTWKRVSTSKVKAGGTIVDTVRLTIGSSARGPGGLMLADPATRLGADAQTVDVTYERTWPEAVRVSRGGFALDLSPRAGLDVSGDGAAALAGASVRAPLHGALAALGFSASPAATGKGGWFLFAEGGGEILGMHINRDGRSLLQRPDVTLEEGAPASVVSDAQAGLGWRRGEMQASFGYVHREIRNPAAAVLIHDPRDIQGDMVAVTFRLRSH